MSAMNGLAALGRTRGRIVGCCLTLALALCALVVGPAVASAEQTTYVATGDSIGFGYTQEKFNLHFPNEAPVFFEEGFDHYLTGMLAKPSEVGKGIIDVNTSCPGETSNGFIGENKALGGETSTEPNGGEERFNYKGESEGFIQGYGDYHPCAYRSLKGLPLHTSLGNRSQLEQILSILKEGAPKYPVKAITLNIGGNDELAQIALCKHEVGLEWAEIAKGEKTESQYKGKSPQESFENCVGKKAETVLIPHLLGNIGKILGAITSKNPGGGHYTGAIVVVGFYNPNSFVLPGSDRLQRAVNEELVLHVLSLFPNVTFANPFPVFNKAAEKVEQHPATVKYQEVEQAAICKYTEMCNPNVQVAGGKPEGKDGDIHPSLTGYKQLATLANKAWVANPAK